LHHLACNFPASGVTIYNDFDLAMRMIQTPLRLLLALAALLTIAEARAAQAQTGAQKVLAAMIEALGGKAFLEVKEIHTTGRFYEFNRGELTGADVFVDYIKFPDMERTEFGRERNRSITINKGNEGWTIEGRNKEVARQSAVKVEEFLAYFRTSFDYVTRFVLDLPRTTVQSVGTEFVDFKRADVIEIRDPAKNLIRLYIDRETRLPLKMQVRRANDSTLREELYSNWHKVNGVMTPLYVARSSNGMKTMEIRVETAAYNSGLDDALFAPPAAK